MNNFVKAEYERMEKIFKKRYGTIHICGECVHTTTCKRMKIQALSASSAKKKELMISQVPFVTEFSIDKYIPRNCQKPLQFVTVYKCDRFVFDKGGNQ